MKHNGIGELVVLETLKECVSDWGEDFTIQTVKVPGECLSHEVRVKHKWLGNDYRFYARAGDDGVEMEYIEDGWCPLNKENLFAFMWFEESGLRDK